MDNKENLKNYIDGYIADKDVDISPLSQFIKNKAKDIVNNIRNNGVNEASGTAGVKLHGNEVLANGKVVGSLKNENGNFDDGIKFAPADGGKTKDFDNIEALYGYVATTYKVNENTINQGLGTQIPDPAEKKVGDGLNDFNLDKVGDANLPSPDNTASQVSPTKRGRKIKSLVDQINKGGRPTSSKQTT